MAECPVCFRHCKLNEGDTGFCHARICRNGEVVPKNYGLTSSLALDPIEKKPLRRFFPGSKILSTGGIGCNLRCPFCQNYAISYSDEIIKAREQSDIITPESLVRIALKYKSEGNIGIAHTYNEPLINYEYIVDTAVLAKRNGLKTVVVTNGSADSFVSSKLYGLIYAMNIDLKAFTDRFYKDLLMGDRQTVMEFIKDSCKWCHVELTCLIIPEENDSEDEIIKMSEWIASLNGGEGKNIPLHISRFFPRFKMTDKEATDVAKIYRLADIARRQLNYVYTGNC